jgi:hypothetical protein
VEARDVLVECRNFINGFVLQSDIPDRWQWDPDIVGGYTVRGAYQILTMRALPSVDGVGDLVWHKQVPLKVSIFAWRLLQDRLPTKINLVRREIIHHDAARCVAGCTSDESVWLICFFIVMCSVPCGS